MSIKTLFALTCVAVACLGGSAQAQSPDAGRFMRFAAGAGGGSPLARPPRFNIPGRSFVRPDKPRIGGAGPGRCHGRKCFDPGKVVVTPSTCPKGMVRRPDGHGCMKVGGVSTCPTGKVRRPGRGCIDVGGVAPCPKGTHRERGRCIPHGHFDDDGPVVVVDPGKGCKAGFKRRGRTCVSVVPPLPPKVIDPVPPKVAVPDDRDDDSSRPKSAGRKGKIKPPAVARAAVIPPDVRALVTDRPFRPGELVVLVATNGADSAIADLVRRHGLVAQEQHRIALAGGTLVRFNIGDRRTVAEVLAAVSRDPRVLLSQPNYSFTASDAGPTKVRGAQYAPAKIRLPEAHAIARGRGTRLAILDTAIDAEHAEIKGAIADSFDALNEGPMQAEAHGTAITGVISARASLDGVAPDASILSVRAFASTGEGGPKSTSMAIVKGIDWAFANNARLFNLSFAGPDDPLLSRVIVEASAKGAIFVAASGNGGPKAAPAYPAAYKDVIAVTATDENDGLFELATGGAHVAVAAPGVDILAPAPGGRYDVSSGTSLAAAHVTGVIALMMEEDPALSQVDVRAILAKTAQRIANTPAKGAGRIDAAAAAAATGSLRVVHPQARVAAD